jgi:hypothetical protein
MIVSSVIVDVNRNLIIFIDQENRLLEQHSVDLSKLTLSGLNKHISSEATLNGHQLAGKIGLDFNFSADDKLTIMPFVNPESGFFNFDIPTVGFEYDFKNREAGVKIPIYDATGIVVGFIMDGIVHLFPKGKPEPEPEEPEPEEPEPEEPEPEEPEPEHRGNSENEKSPFGYLFDGLLNILFPAAYAAEIGGYELRAIPYDPLVLDLNHNGVIDTANIENGAYFDGGNEDFSEKMGWGIGRGWSALH